MTNTTSYRVRWEIDIDATSKLEAAQTAERIMRTPVDGTPDQARVMEVRPASSAFWTEMDLADPALDEITTPILPPARDYVRARGWRMFLNTFGPVATRNGFIVEAEDIPKDADPRSWWTVVDLAPDSNRLYLVPGFAHVNRLGFVRCLHPWGGNADDHPLYLYQ